MVGGTKSGVERGSKDKWRASIPPHVVFSEGMIYIYIYIQLLQVGEGGFKNPGSHHKGDQTMPLSYKALGNRSDEKLNK